MSDFMINIIKDPSLFDELSKYNSDITKVTDKYEFNSNYDLVHNKISPWFNPANVRNLGLSRTYPYMDPCQYRREYCLYLHCSNYLPLFLINQLYEPKNKPLIEDIGGGMGWLFAYLARLGFNNFHLVENFSQLSKKVAEDFIKTLNLNCQINKEVSPMVVNNVGVPGVLVRKLDPKIELITFYTNRGLEKNAKEYLAGNGFTYLCKDSDDLAVAYCRNDLYGQFRSKLEAYVYTPV